MGTVTAVTTEPQPEGRSARVTGYVRPSVKAALKRAAAQNRVSESVLLDMILGHALLKKADTE